MVSESESRLIEAVGRARERLYAGRRMAEEEMGRSETHRHHLDLLRRIRRFHQQILFPIVQSRQHIVEHVGTVWLEEDIDPPHQLPRVLVHFNSINTAVDAPRAFMTFHVGENGTTFVSRNYESPIKTTDVTLGRLEELSAEVIERFINEFLTKALEG
jgi:hypothetical protein